MFDVGWSELVVIGVVALVVIGPKELPGVIRSVGRAVGKLRTMAGEFRGQFDDAMREAELHEVKKTFTDAADAATSAANSFTEPVTSLQNEIHTAAAEVSGAAAMSDAVAGIQADATAMEAEAKAVGTAESKAVQAEPEPEAAPKKRRKKTDDTGDAA